jgi:L-alanine-DL-glutamate epimerase-like enolase superfamily enzyme
MARLMTVREAAEYLGVPVAHHLPGHANHARAALAPAARPPREAAVHHPGVAGGVDRRVASEPEAPARSMRLVGETPLFEGAEGQ